MTAVQGGDQPQLNGDARLPYESVDDVFTSLTISEIRSLEVQLRDQAAQRRTDLQVLVGESYRDLLTTADTLVRMRDETLTLRTALATLRARCDEDALERIVRNRLKYLQPASAKRERCLRSFLRDVPGLISARASQGDLSTASQLWVLADHLSKTMTNEKANGRLADARRRLERRIDEAKDLTSFAIAHCQLHPASLAACLKHWLALQPDRLRSQISLSSLAEALIQVIEQLRQFARFADAFEEASKIVLADTLVKLPEVDGVLIRDCLPSELAKKRVPLPGASLSHSDIQEHFQIWLGEASLTIQRIIQECLLAQHENMAAVLLTAKQVRNFLDEASQDALYVRLFAPAIDTFIATVLDRSLAGFTEVKEDLNSLITSIPQDTQQSSILGTTIPWQQNELAPFLATTRRIVRGDLAPDAFISFEKRYTAVVETVREHLAVLSSNKSFQQGGYKEMYGEKVRNVLAGLLQRLIEMTETIRHNKPALIQTFRLLRYLCKTAPIPMDGAKEEEIIAGKLTTFLPGASQLPVFLARDLVVPDEAGQPTMPSPSCATSLVAWCRCLESLGLDVIGPALRQGARDRIKASIEAAVGQQGMSLPKYEEVEEILPQHRPSAPRTPLLAPNESGALLTLQATFDAMYVSALLSLNLDESISREAKHSGLDISAFAPVISDAVTKSKLFYKTLIA